MLIESGYQLTVHGSSDKCRSRIRGFVEQGRCLFKVGNILDLPFADRAFGTVLSYRLLAHVRSWRRFLCELARVAEHTVILDFPSTRSLNYFSGRLFGLKKRLEGNTRPFTCFAESELVRVFAEQGFIPSNRYAEFLLPMVLHRALKLPLVSAGVEGAFRISGLTYLFGSPVILKFVREGH